MKIADLQSLTSSDISQMNAEELRGIIDTAGRHANKRLERLEERFGEKSSTPASAYAEKSGGEFTAEGKTRNELVTEVKRLKGFIEAKTSTITGALKVERQFLKRVRANAETFDIERQKDFWKEYRKYTEEHPNRVSSRQDSNSAQRQLYDTMFANIDPEEYDDLADYEADYTEALKEFHRAEETRYEKTKKQERENIKKRAVKNGNISKFFNNSRDK